MENFSKDIINKAIDYAGKIYDAYKELSDLEKYYQKDSDIYLQKVGELEKLVQEERAYYETITPRMASFFLNQLFSPFLDFEDYVNACFKLDREKMALTRVSFRLEDILDTREYDEEDEDPEEDENIDSLVEAINADLDDTLDEEVNIDYLNALDRAFEEDLVNTIIFFLNMYISAAKYNRIKDYLVHYKYFLIYIFIANETGYIERKFRDNGELYWGMRVVYDMEQDNNEKEYQNIINELSQDLLYDHGDELLNGLFTDIGDEEYYARAMFSQIIIRAVSVFISEEDFRKFADFLEGEIDNVDNDNYLIESVIRGSVHRRKNDLDYPRIIRLRNKKN